MALYAPMVTVVEKGLCTVDEVAQLQEDKGTQSGSWRVEVAIWTGLVWRSVTFTFNLGDKRPRSALAVNRLKPTLAPGRARLDTGKTC